MTRGNQRELARAKNMKKTPKRKDAAEHESNKGLTLTQRKERDAKCMREKQQKKQEGKEENVK